MKLSIEWYTAMINHYSEMYYKLSLVENNSNEDLSNIKEKMDKISDEVLEVIDLLELIHQRYTMLHIM